MVVFAWFVATLVEWLVNMLCDCVYTQLVGSISAIIVDLWVSL